MKISVCTRVQVLKNIWLEFPNVFILKGNQERFIKFLYSLKPKSCSSITQEDYDKMFLFRANGKESLFVYNLLSFENEICGKESRLLLTS